MTPLSAVSDRPKAEQEFRAAKQRHEQQSDALYIVGAVLVVAGIAMFPHGRPLATIAAGAFFLLFPCTEILMSFIRGLRSPGTK